MFTIKYVSFRKVDTQPVDEPTHYERTEQISGPYEMVSQEVVDGDVVVCATREGGAPGVTFGLVKVGVEPDHPRPTIYVMNAHGATVAKYDL